MTPRSFLYSSRPVPPSTSSSSQSSTFRSKAPHSSPRFQSTTLPSPVPREPSQIVAAPIAISSATKHVESRPEPTTITVTPVRSSSSNSLTTRDFYTTMGKRKDRREAASLSPPADVSITKVTRPATPTSPVQIPQKQSTREAAHPQKRRSNHPKKHRRDVHDADSLSPSVAALLAMTDIPRPRQSLQRRNRADSNSTTGDVMDGPLVSEKQMSWSIGRGPMDVLLSPPEELVDDDLSLCESAMGSMLSTRTISVDSIPSLGDSFATDLASSLDTPGSMSPSGRRRRPSPMRRSLEPVRSPPDTIEEHPLAANRFDAEEIGFAALPPAITDSDTGTSPLNSFKPLRAVFKSNLTASLRALRSAAKSFSSLNFPSLPPDDVLTRSMLTIDPKVPYTDERRPPVTEEMPSAELRRYLNPSTGSRAEASSATMQASGAFSASIQMQTYKVHRSRSAPPAPRSVPTSNASSPPKPQTQTPGQTAFTYPPGMRQREMRENSDFIRIAVMEMAMRKRGKLDDQRPGRARWALPPRKAPLAPYEMGANGVPARWVSVSF